MAALYLTTMLLVQLVDGVGVGYYRALFGRVCLIFLMLVNQCAAAFLCSAGDGKATHGMEDSLPVLVLLRRIEMALSEAMYLAAEGKLIGWAADCCISWIALGETWLALIDNGGLGLVLGVCYGASI
ncbi:hypothetical protein Nepgr_033571 [Nepenthes gracilis]|uniref:Solute carrier family 40 protein n=1 Tax=Nepenthes gracilis TaxID=150966 RepID=A0AAD3TMT4_NEPGR|nr:hypothetical protein Nepgr_033571 [Nepenthes gracilis]